MTKTKSTKRALLMGVLSMFLCVVMLAGTTFAWFTDTVTSTNNIIKSGNLNVEMYYADGTLDPASVAWTNANGVAIYKADQLWEPGYTDAKHIKISNEGNLGLKYQLAIIPTGEVSDLAEVIDVYLYEIDKTDLNATKVATRADLNEDMYVGTLKKVISQGIVQGNLKAGTDYTTTIVLKMKEEAGNEYKEKSIGDSFTIQLLATQLADESDSFDNTYDADAWVDGMQIYSASDLQAAINAGETDLKLMDDIVLDESIVIPASATTFSMRSVTPAIVIDLNGKNITIEATYDDANYLASSAIVNNGNLILTGEGSVKATNNYTVRNYGTMVIDGITVENGIMNYSDLTVESGNISNSRSGKHAIYSYNAKLTINGGTFYNGNPGNATIFSYAGEVEINGGEFSIADGTATLGWTSCLLDAQGNAKFTINGGIINGEIRDYNKNTTIKGGIFNHDSVNNFIADGYQAVDNGDGTYTVKFPQESFDKLIENAQAGDTVEIPAGEYTFPASELKEGMTLNCAEGTVFEGNSKLNIKGATVVGATFSNPTGTAADQTINGTFKDCTFTGKNGLRWCYAGDTVVFENCTFSGDVYGVHFDGGANEAIFRNCTFSGFNAMGGEIAKLTMEGCTFKANGRSGYNGINLWGSTDMIDCTFVFDGTTTEWVDACGDNKVYNFTNCVVTDGETETPIETVVGNYGDGNTITIDGVSLATNNDMLKAAVAAGATKVMLADGEYDLSGNQKNGLTLIGVGDDVKVANTTKYASGKAVGAITKAINFENVTITNTVYTMENGSNATFTNVNFAAGFRQGYGKNVVFTDCTFGSNSEGYALHFQTDYASEGGKITLKGCEFEGGKVHLGGKRAYEFTDCDFAAGTDFQVWSNITLDGCTVDGVAVTDANVATFFTKLNLEKVTLK